MQVNNDELKEVYSANSSGEAHRRYEDWASSYDADNIRWGFRLPSIGAAYVARHVPTDAGPILDAGCGTGLVGEALSILGYSQLHGLDLSGGMLRKAKEIGVYDELLEHELGKPFTKPNDYYAAFTCFGSFGPGHAAPESLNELVRVVRPGGRAIFNLREDTYVEQGFARKLAQLSDIKQWHEVERSPAFRPFLLAEPQLSARIFVFEIGQ